MEYVIEQASSYDEAVSKLQEQYGHHLKIYAKKRIERRGLFGRHKPPLFEVSAYCYEEAELKQDAISKIVEQEIEPPIEEGLTDADLSFITDTLIANEFTPAYISYILNRLKSECTPSDLLRREIIELKVLTWISESIKVDRKGQISIPHLFILLGSTGVGKTTTIAKIAALRGLSTKQVQKANRVRIVNIDTYRIGARAQINTFGEIMGIPVDEIHTKEELDSYLNTYSGSDSILIDTIGKSPKDVEIHREMVKILNNCITDPEASFVLAVSASMKNSDISRMIKRFVDFPISSIILTKLDETEMVGNLISLIHELDFPLLYAATGQRVPQDLVPMTEGLFLRRLQGFSVDLENLRLGEDTDYIGISNDERDFLNL